MALTPATCFILSFLTLISSLLTVYAMQHLIGWAADAARGTRGGEQRQDA